MFILVAPTIVSFLMLSCGHQHTITEKYRINYFGIPSTVEVVRSKIEYSAFEPVHEIGVSLTKNAAIAEQQKAMPNMISSRVARFMCRSSGARVAASDASEQQDIFYQCSLKEDEINTRLALAQQRFAGMELVDRKEEGRWGIY